MKNLIETAIKTNKTRFFKSQPMPVSYSRTRYSHDVRGATAIQEAFMNALVRGV